eukprot:919194-Amphidinium_carterae.1
MLVMFLVRIVSSFLSTLRQLRAHPHTIQSIGPSPVYASPAGSAGTTGLEPQVAAKVEILFAHPGRIQRPCMERKLKLEPPPCLFVALQVVA